MELFSEIYGTYYKTLGEILAASQEKSIPVEEIRSIIDENGFSDSGFFIMPKLTENDWPLLQAEGDEYISKVQEIEEMPLTSLQQSWLKAILNDPKIKLFFDDEDLKSLNESLVNVVPLFDYLDFYIYDNASDGDAHESSEYRTNFRVILNAIRDRQVLLIDYNNKKNKRMTEYFKPYKIEYSQKDDKFRILAHSEGRRTIKNYILNMSRIESVKVVEGFSISFEQSESIDQNARDLNRKNTQTKREEKFKYHKVNFEISEERNALDRVLVQFANHEKTTVYDEEKNRYLCTMKYNALDETEILIMLLSFGPTIKITGPGRFLNLFKDRVARQRNLLMT